VGDWSEPARRRCIWAFRWHAGKDKIGASFGRAGFRDVAWLRSILEDVRQHVASHLPGHLDAVDVQNRRSDVKDADWKAQEPHVLLDIRTNRNKGTGHIISIFEVMVGNYGCGAAVIVNRRLSRLLLLKFTQRLDAMIRNHKDVRVCVDMFQDFAQHLIKGSVLVGKGIQADIIDLGVVADIVGLDWIEPMPYAVLAGLGQHHEIGGVIGQQVIKQLKLLVSNLGNLREPVVNYF
jgi:hypothetical protein